MDAFKSLIIIIKYNINKAKNVYTNLLMNFNIIIIMCLMKFSLPSLFFNTFFYVYVTQLHQDVRLSKNV